MPTKSPSQKRLMQAAAHTKGGFGGVPQKVGKEFVKADKMAEGGVVQSLKKAGFYGAGKDKAERLKIIDDVTTKPQRVQIVEKLFSTKKMKEGGLYANIHAKQERIAKGSDERMRKPGSKGAPTAEAFRDSAKTKRMADGGVASLGGMVSSTPNTPTVASRDNSRAPQNMLDGAQQTADNSIEGGDGEKVYGYKKGGHITTRRMSTCSPSKNSSNW